MTEKDETKAEATTGGVPVERGVRPPAWVVELYEGLQWLAPGGGDPGRTCIWANAKRYKSERAAKCALAYAKRMNPHRNFADARVVAV